MNFLRTISLFLFMSGLSVSSYAMLNEKACINNVVMDYASFYLWKELCDTELPMYDQYEAPNTTTLTCEIMCNELQKFFNTMNNDQNLKTVIPQKGVFNPYIQKVIVPQGSIVAFHGDLHGDVHSLNDFIQYLMNQGYMNHKFKIINDKVYIVFLGDYTDRGWYGSEVIYTILKLKNCNPDRVFMVRGNHEDVNLNARYTFKKELENKFVCKGLEQLAASLVDSEDTNSEEVLKEKAIAIQSIPSQIYHMYNYLPLALYLGSVDANGCTHYIQCCHGGLEVGYDPKEFLNSSVSVALIDTLQRSQVIDGLFQDPTKKYILKKYLPDGKPTTNNGFMWADFCVDQRNDMFIDETAGRIQWGKVPTTLLRKQWSKDKSQLHAIFRGHQHGQKAMDNRILNYDGLDVAGNAGVGKLWLKSESATPCNLKDIDVVTFAVAPQTPYNYPYHAFGLLQINDSYDQWKLHAVRLDENGLKNDKKHCSCLMDGE